MSRLLSELKKDLPLINALSIVLIFAVALFPGSLIRTLVGIPFVLFFPGYVLVCSLFPKKKDLDGIERVALSLGLSLAVVPLMGLMLNYTPFGIRLYPVLFSLFLFVLSMSAVAAYRRKLLPAEERFAPSLPTELLRHGLGKSNKLMFIGLIACVVIVGGFTAHLASTPRVGERFTEFYVLGPECMIKNYPTNLTLGESGIVILGIVNHEHERVSYEIVVEMENETMGIIDNIGLEHGESWEQRFTFTPQRTCENSKLGFLLFKGGETEPYRSLQLWITVSPHTEL